MAKDIERIIEDTVMPEMEYVKPRHRTTTIDDVPEVVLPKTKMEVYEEAKGRLEQKTHAASKAYNKSKKKTGQKSASTNRNIAAKAQKTVKTVELDSAASRVFGEASIVERENIKKHKASPVKKICSDPKWVGSADELIPFAWRKPLKPDIARQSKVYKAAVHAEQDRALLLPTPRD